LRDINRAAWCDLRDPCHPWGQRVERSCDCPAGLGSSDVGTTLFWPSRGRRRDARRQPADDVLEGAFLVAAAGGLGHAAALVVVASGNTWLGCVASALRPRPLPPSPV
jgi:hypothetical protein